MSSNTPTQSQSPLSASNGLYVRVPSQVTQGYLVRVVLRVWLISLGASEEEVFSILLAVNEALANAIEHPRNPTSPTVLIRTCYEAGAVEVLVRDTGAWSGEAVTEHRSAGMALMAAFTDHVEVHSDHRGTVVLLRKQLHAPQEPPTVLEAHDTAGAFSPALR